MDTRSKYRHENTMAATTNSTAQAGQRPTLPGPSRIDAKSDSHGWVISREPVDVSPPPPPIGWRPACRCCAGSGDATASRPNRRDLKNRFAAETAPRRRGVRDHQRKEAAPRESSSARSSRERFGVDRIEALVGLDGEGQQKA